MKLSDIKFIFMGEMAFQDFKANISGEISKYVTLLRAEGRSVPVYLVEDVDLMISEHGLKILCEAYLNEELDEEEIGYIADALLLSDRVSFESEHLSDCVGYLTDPEINGVLCKETVRSILKS